MTMNMDRKGRILSFRVSEAEYNEIDKTRSCLGFSSTSEFARAAVVAGSNSTKESVVSRPEANEIRVSINLLMANAELLTDVRKFLSDVAPLLDRLNTTLELMKLEKA